MNQVINISLTDISENMWNPHSSTVDELNNITTSLKEVGQLIPVLVAEWDTDITWDNTLYTRTKKYILIDGHQRFTCMKELFKQGDNNALFLKAIVVGKTSEYQAWELAEFGQVANHARGSLEDDLKTGKLLQELTKYRNVTDYVKITNQRSDYVNRAMTLIQQRNTNSHKVANIPVASHTRGYHNVSLPFEDAAEVKEFEDLLAKLPTSGKSYKGLDRSYKLLNLLKEALDGQEEK